MTASGTTQGTGPSDTNTRDTATGTQTRQDSGYTDTNGASNGPSNTNTGTGS